jgi:tetratricopeptide (TPR) repeat protein
VRNIEAVFQEGNRLQTMKTLNLDYFWQKVELANSFLNKDDVEMTKLLENCLNELALQPELVMDSDYNHLKGYIYYSMRPQKLSEAKTEFEKSLKLDSSNFHSKLYLGHTYYDLGDYQNAQKQFDSITENSLPDWLMMKADEMVICCKFHTTSKPDEQELQRFLEKYAPSDYLDDYPFELSKLLKQIGISLENEDARYRKII